MCFGGCIQSLPAQMESCWPSEDAALDIVGADSFSRWLHPAPQRNSEREAHHEIESIGENHVVFSTDGCRVS